MNSNDKTARYLGGAFLAVILTSLVSGAAADSALGSGSVAGILANASTNAGAMHVAILAGMLNAVGILVLATLLYAVLRVESKTMALIGVLCWTGEAFFYALQAISWAGLIRAGTDFAAAGSPANSFYQALGSFLYQDGYELSGTILMFFYCAGGLLFYYLFWESRFIPRWLAGYGLAAVVVGLAGGSAELLGNHIGMAAYIAIGPFELVTGCLLAARGVGGRVARLDTSAATVR